MHTEGYTVFTGPLKHATKKNNQAQNIESEVYKKSEHANKKTLDGAKIARIMNDQEDHKPRSMPQDLRIAIAQARNEKGWNQQQFAKLIQVPKADVNSWEAGKSAPTGLQIAKMDKVLGVKLPRPPKK